MPTPASLRHASAISTRLCLAAIHVSRSTVEASYSCRIGLASNLASALRRQLPIHNVDAAVAELPYIQCLLQFGLRSGIRPYPQRCPIQVNIGVPSKSSIHQAFHQLTPPIRSLISLSQNPPEFVRYQSSNLTRRI